MRTRCSKNSGFTLIEIIVSSTVVGVLLLGIITASISIQRSSKSAADSYFVTFSTQNLLNHIIQEAYKAVGSPSYPGVIIGTAPAGTDASGNPVFAAGTGDADTMCFFQQNYGVEMGEIIANGGALPGYLPADAAVPTWACYTYPAVGSYGDVHFCKNAFVNDSAVNYGAGVCTTASSGYVKSLGSVKSVTPSFSIVATQGGAQKALFEVSVLSCLNPALGCASGDAANPAVTKNGGVSPAAHSV